MAHLNGDSSDHFQSLLERKKARSLQASVYSRDVIFVPYRSDMIPKYCSWFADEYICKSTSTHKMTEEETRDAHRKWTEDHDKVVFIVLARDEYEKTKDQIRAMIGDVNLVIRRAEESDAIGGARAITAEVMLMIAEEQFRGKGLGRQMLQLLLRYGWEEYSVSIFEARIGFDNLASLALFKSCGFQPVSTDEMFREHLLRKVLTGPTRSMLIQETDLLGYNLSTTTVGGSAA